MSKVTVGILTKKQVLALFVPNSKKWKAVNSNSKEFYTDREVEEVTGVLTNPLYTFPPGREFGGTWSKAPGNDPRLAEDDCVHSYDNNFDLWR
jgi:hypothetical protein